MEEEIIKASEIYGTLAEAIRVLEKHGYVATRKNAMQKFTAHEYIREGATARHVSFLQEQLAISIGQMLRNTGVMEFTQTETTEVPQMESLLRVDVTVLMPSLLGEH